MAFHTGFFDSIFFLLYIIKYIVREDDFERKQHNFGCKEKIIRKNFLVFNGYTCKNFTKYFYISFVLEPILRASH